MVSQPCVGCIIVSCILYNDTLPLVMVTIQLYSIQLCVGCMLYTVSVSGPWSPPCCAGSWCWWPHPRPAQLRGPAASGPGTWRKMTTLRYSKHDNNKGVNKVRIFRTFRHYPPVEHGRVKEVLIRPPPAQRHHAVQPQGAARLQEHLLRALT